MDIYGRQDKEATELREEQMQTARTKGLPCPHCRRQGVQTFIRDRQAFRAHLRQHGRAAGLNR